MVDIATVTKMTVDTVTVVPDADAGTDLGKQEDVDWFTGIIISALSECGEPQAILEIHAAFGRTMR